MLKHLRALYEARHQSLSGTTYIKLTPSNPKLLKSILILFSLACKSSTRSLIFRLRPTTKVVVEDLHAWENNIKMDLGGLGLEGVSLTSG
jgi:hypothetical protein